MAHAGNALVGCDGFRAVGRMRRRALLRVGGLWGMGLLLPDLFQARARAGVVKDASATLGRAKSVIMLYLHGGHAQQETWDPKPDGPSPARGEFGAIPTSLPGVRISELLPLSAQIMDRLAVIRSLSHPNANHVQAALPAMTGHAHPANEESRGDFPPSPNDFPAIGAVLDLLRPSKNLPTWVQIGPTMRRMNGTVLHGQSPGFLGGRHSPLVIDEDLLPRHVRLDALSTDASLPQRRIASRRDLLSQVDYARRAIDQAVEVRSLNAFQQKALNLLASAQTAKAFDLADEPESVRDHYGRNSFGQCCLLARRLAEAGVPMINVHYCRTPPGWDTHGQHFKSMKESLCPTFDMAFSALVNDLDRRGLLDQTLVLANAEFGRTPKVNKAAGRDHWPWVYTIALAGAGLKRGVVYGASDNIAAYPNANPHDPADMAATIYHLLGVPGDTVVHDQFGRPYPLVIGRKIDGLLA
jgi:uncharacterized protein (DUF1501 family)